MNISELMYSLTLKWSNEAVSPNSEVIIIELFIDCHYLKIYVIL